MHTEPVSPLLNLQYFPVINVTSAIIYVRLIHLYSYGGNAFATLSNLARWLKGWLMVGYFGLK